MVGFILLLIVFVPLVAGPIIRHVLQSAVAGNLNATLTIDNLQYHPIWGVTIGHALLTTPGPNGEAVPVAELGGLQVNLAGAPIGGPIVVENFKLINPIIDLVQLPNGQWQIEQNFLRESDSSSPAPASTSHKKLSAMLQIEHLEISNMVVRTREWNSAAEPQVLAKLDVKADQTTGPSQYDVHISVANKPLAEMSLDGSVDVDGGALDFKNFTFTGQVPSQAALAAYPASIQSLCNDYGLADENVTMSFGNNASVTIDTEKNHWRAQNLSGQLKLANANGQQGFSGAITWSISAGGPLPSGNDDLIALIGQLDPDTAISIATMPNNNINIQAAALGQPVTNVTTALEWTKRTITVKDFSGQYGTEPIHLDATAVIGEKELRLKEMRLNAAGGTLVVNSLDAQFAPPHAYDAKVVWLNIDLAKLKGLAKIADPNGHISGLASGELNISGTLPAGTPVVNAAKGDGNFQVRDGDFADIRVISAVLGKLPGLQQVTRVGDAAGVFTFDSGMLHFSKAAVNSLAVGIQAKGDVGMSGDNQLNLNLMVAPLGDWKKDVNKANIPVIGDAFGQVLGTAQKAINKTQKLLYTFNVTGPATAPRVNAAAAPGISKDAEDVFNQMVNTGKGGLLDAIKATTQVGQNK